MYPVNTFILLICYPGHLRRMNTQAQQEEVEYFIQAVTCQLPASQTHLNIYLMPRTSYATTSKVITYCQSEWPHKHQISERLRPY